MRCTKKFIQTNLPTVANTRSALLKFLKTRLAKLSLTLEGHPAYSARTTRFRAAFVSRCFRVFTARPLVLVFGLSY